RLRYATVNGIVTTSNSNVSAAACPLSPEFHRLHTTTDTVVLPGEDRNTGTVSSRKVRMAIHSQPNASGWRNSGTAPRNRTRHGGAPDTPAAASRSGWICMNALLRIREEKLTWMRLNTMMVSRTVPYRLYQPLVQYSATTMAPSENTTLGTACGRNATKSYRN